MNLNSEAKGATGGQGPGRRGIFFVCGPNVDIIQLLCASKRRSGVCGQNPWLEDWGGAKPPKAETFLAMKAANLPAFNI